MAVRYSLRSWRAAIVAAWIFTLAPIAIAVDLRDENAVRAAYVFNLTKYVEWPAASTSLRVCYLGDGPMGAVLKSTLQGKVSEKRSIDVVLEPGDEPSGRCDVLYVGFHSPERIRAILARPKTHNILTVGDTDLFAASGGMIGLVTQGEHIKLQVNLQAVQSAQLRISSRVLALATIVNSAGGAR